MKKLLTLTAIGTLLFTAPAISVQKCVALNETTTCDTDIVSYGTTEHTRTCITNGIDFPVTITGMVSQTIATAPLEIQATIDTTSVNTGTCWCRIIRPVVSKWISLQVSGNQYQCPAQCINNIMSTDTQVRQVLLNALFN
ncbi:MAG: hypothetical protein E7009_02845 [Alphaproteobacteria bacterium]|nr:hypothetical protein [Alphaproteobacteria bacterium]MBQ7127435.1 hypothetical protein [Alphaproteobacteria bacterium]